MLRLITPLLALLLVLGLMLGFWPPGNGRWLLTALCLLSAACWYWRDRRRGHTVAPPDEQALPPRQFTGAVVLVCAAGESLFPHGQQYRETRQGWYIAVRQPQQLAGLAGHLAAARPALLSRLSVLLAVIPEQWQQSEAFSSQLLEWQRAIACCRLPLTGIPAVWLCSWLNAVDARSDGGYRWYSLRDNREGIQVEEPGRVVQDYSSWCRDSHPGSPLPRISHSLWLQALFSWLKLQVLAGLAARDHHTPALPPCMIAVCSGPVSAASNNLWQQHTAALTTLPAIAEGGSMQALPLPDALLAHLPQRNAISPQMQRWRTGGLFAGLLLLLAIIASYSNNQRLIRTVSDHLAFYQRISDTPAQPKVQAQNQLRRDDALLASWQQQGAPLRYSLGLYQGMRLIAPLRAAINGWAPTPVTPPAPLEDSTAPVQSPQTLRLHSMSLFDSGKALLKPGSTKQLVSALAGIKARPGWLIVVSGHTDNTGNPARNQALSLQRAEAVRDWMRETGDVPESCFAVQGYGQSRPAAANDTAEGRALNRRVEIILLPQADACRLSGNTPASGQEADAETQPKEK